MSSWLIGSAEANLRILDLFLRESISEFITDLDDSECVRSYHQNNLDAISNKLDMLASNIGFTAHNPNFAAIRKELGEIRGMLNDGADYDSQPSDATLRLVRQRIIFFYSELPKLAIVD